MLCEKYAPNTLNGIIGNDEAVDRLNRFAEGVHRGNIGKPLLLYGPSGTGKTAAAHALAYMNSFELLELSASDYRGVERLRRVLLPASNSRGLFGKTILILLDEIDELSYRFDSGAQTAITQLVSNSRQPIIFTAEDYWDQKISFLRNSVERVEFKRVGINEIARLLSRIAKKEGVELEEGIIDEIAKRSSGDLRGAINDLELMLGARKELIENLGTRDRKLEIFGVLDKIFLSNNFETARNAMAKSDIDMEMMLNWVDENIPRRYTSRKGIGDAYENLAEASRFSEKASRTNYYGYLRYASVLLSSGTALSNDGYTSMLRQYSFPSRIRYMSSTKRDRAALNDIAGKLSAVLHTNKRKIIREYVPLLRASLSRMVKERGEEDAISLSATLFGLEESEMRLFLG